MNYLDAWNTVASALFAQALAGEPELNESLPKPMATGAFAFATTVSGELAGRFVVVLDPELLNASLLGDGMDQKAGWAEVLREVAEAACGELLAKGGIKCKVESFVEAGAESQISRAFQLRSAERTWTVLVRDEVKPAEAKPAAAPAAPPPQPAMHAPAAAAPPLPVLTPGLELMLDVELEASLRFGCREIPLGELLDLGPGDVVELDRHIADPVDLLVGDKIVARGEVVLVNGDFGLRVTEVSAPRKRLESIRCLF